MSIQEDLLKALDQIPSNSAIELIARDNVLLYRVLRASNNVGLSWEMTMQLAVKCLVEQNNELHKNMVKVIENSTRTVMVSLKDKP